MGVGLQVDVVDLALLAEVLLDVEVLRLLRETAHKELPIILTVMERVSFNQITLYSNYNTDRMEVMRMKVRRKRGVQGICICLK